MSELTTDIATLEFVPLKPTRPARLRTPVDLSRFPMAHRVRRLLDEPLAALARQLRRHGPLDGGSIILLCGCGPGVGCTTMTLALAGAAAVERSVLVMDAAPGDTGLSSDLGNPVGWNDALREGRPAQRFLQPVDRKGAIMLLPRGKDEPLASPVPQAEMLASLGSLRDAYDLILVDGGTVEPNGVRWTPLADATLLVCGTDPNAVRQWATAWDRLEEAGGSMLGVVETFV